MSAPSFSTSWHGIGFGEDRRHAALLVRACPVAGGVVAGGEAKRRRRSAGRPAARRSRRPRRRRDRRSAAKPGANDSSSRAWKQNAMSPIATERFGRAVDEKHRHGQQLAPRAIDAGGVRRSDRHREHEPAARPLRAPHCRERRSRCRPEVTLSGIEPALLARHAAPVRVLFGGSFGDFAGIDGGLARLRQHDRGLERRLGDVVAPGDPARSSSRRVAGQQHGQADRRGLERAARWGLGRARVSAAAPGPGAPCSIPSVSRCVSRVQFRLLIIRQPARRSTDDLR